MKKLLILLTTLAFVMTGCSTGTLDIDPELGNELAGLAGDAETLVTNLEDENPELGAALDALREEATTVSSAVLAGELSEDDLDSLEETLEGFQADLSAVTGELNAETADALASFESEMEAAVDGLEEAADS